MAAHNIIKYVVRERENDYLVIGADGSYFTVSPNGELLAVLKPQPDPIATIVKTRREGQVVTPPAPVMEYLNTLCIDSRFPKCFTMLSKIVSGGVKIDSFEKREKQALNELIRHGLIRKSKINYLIP